MNSRVGLGLLHENGTVITRLPSSYSPGSSPSTPMSGGGSDLEFRGHHT